LARTLGKIIFWRSPSESQRVKADIVWLHETQPELSQRTIARMFHISQPYVARLLKRVRLSGCDIEKALGRESYRRYCDHREAQRREHFEALGGPVSLIGESARELRPVFDAPRPLAPTKVETPGTEYVELGRSTNGEVIEIHGSKPASALADGELQQLRNSRPAYVAPASSWVTRFSAKEIAGLYVADQCPSFGRR
jgi:hypothetical protein